jgi:hypothetical protein
MLYAHFSKSISGYGISDISGHVSDKETKKLLNDNYMNVTSIQVDGDELDEAHSILNHVVNRRVFTFVGDEAKTIAANWCSNRHFN